MYILNSKGKIDKVNQSDSKAIPEKELAESLINAMLFDPDGLQLEMDRYEKVEYASEIIARHWGSYSIPKTGGCCG